MHAKPSLCKACYKVYPKTEEGNRGGDHRAGSEGVLRSTSEEAW